MIIGLVLIFIDNGLTQPNIGGSAGAFQRIGLSGRTKAMGNAGTAIAQGYSTAFDNPAFLPIQSSMQLGITMHKLALDRKFSHLAWMTPLKGEAGLSLSWMNAGVEEIDSRDVDGKHIEFLSYFDNAFALGFGISPVPKKMSLGINFKVFYALFPKLKENNQSIKSTGIGFDIGVRYQFIKQVTIGVMLKDIASKYTWNTDGYWSQGSTKVDKIPLQTSLGISFTNKQTTLTIDGQITKQRRIIRLGGEYVVWNDQWLTMALRTGLDGLSPTFGCGFRWSMVRDFETSLDYGYIIERIAPENTHILTWTVYIQ
ncbi:MAG: hypothetical protein N2450_04185 [bacterium]|nr:hypothetical protein [bacterium]